MPVNPRFFGNYDIDGYFGGKFEIVDLTGYYRIVFRKLCIYIAYSLMCRIFFMLIEALVNLLYEFAKYLKNYTGTACFDYVLKSMGNVE